MQTSVRCCARWLIALCALLLPALATAGSDELGEVRRVSQSFVAGLQRREPAAAMLNWFSAEAFTNPVTRQITVFTGGDVNAPPARIRQYVAETLDRAGAARSVKARCPDTSVIRDSLLPGLRPDNDPDHDGFLLKRVNRELLDAMQTEAESTEPQIVWLRNQIQLGYPLVGMTVACNDIPLSMVWRRMKGKWLIVAFAVSLP
jgi:hypothetical protein